MVRLAQARRGSIKSALRAVVAGIFVSAIITGDWHASTVRAQSKAPAQVAAPVDRALLTQYCVTCHNERLKTAGLALDMLDAEHVGSRAETWEKVVRKVRTGMMPPSGARRPNRAVLDAFAGQLEAALDRAAAVQPNAGAPALHRLNRAEYANAIRDLLALDVDVATLLPADDASEGFDNVADVLGVSPALMQGYVSAASKISRLAVGDMTTNASRVTYRVPAGLSQNGHIDGLPLGTRGGLLFRHTSPLDGEYAFRIAGGGGGIGVGGAPGSGANDDVEVAIDGTPAKVLRPRESRDVRLSVKAGPHAIGVAFVPKSESPGVDDTYQVFAGAPGIQSVAITGPFDPNGVGDTPSRRRIFTCQPRAADDRRCADQILRPIARRAYRRPIAVVGDAMEILLPFFEEGRKAETFDAGIQRAIARILVDPEFLFRFEHEPSGIAPGQSYRVSGLELASRLAFFLWSSIPDDELVDVAVKGRLRDAELEKQVRRMLGDPKSRALVSNFGAQWLSLRALKSAQPDARGFNENLRQAFQRETEMLLESVISKDRSLIDLLNPDYTFVDERLARHYGIPNVHGSRFRRVALKPDDPRRGLLGQGSILLVTSVANRTSPVARGKWVLENMLGTPPPVPPPNVEGLDKTAPQTQATSMRQRMEQHRASPVCASCHRIMDPIGFSLENFDLIGKWREVDASTPIDATGLLVDDTVLDGPASLRRALLDRSEMFVTAATEKLLTYALGRAVRYYDMPAIRRIVHDAARNDYRLSSLVLGIVNSSPFQMRTKRGDAPGASREAH
jgi:mono/diheme cytochrome c family protein